MIKALLFFLSLSLILFAKSDIDKEIKQTNGKIKNFSKSYSAINKKMSKTAKAILNQKREILKQKKYLQELIASLSDKEQSYKSDTLKLKDLRKEQEKLKAAQEKIEEELTFTIAKSISLSVVLEENKAQTEESLIEVEVISAMLAKTKKEAKQLNKQFYKNSLVVQKVNKRAEYL